MLRKSVNIIMAVILIFSTGGVIISQHYCNSIPAGKHLSLSVPDKCCGHCKSCRNEVKFVKISDSFNLSDSQAAPEQSVKHVKSLFPVAFLLLSSLNIHYTFRNPPGFNADISQPLSSGDHQAILQNFLL